MNKIYPLDKCQKIKLPQGFIYLGLSNDKQSVGYLELNPKTSLTLHNRPAIEKLTQIKNRGQVVVYSSKENKIITMEENESYVMQTEIWHIHTNPFNKVSLTYWDFEGDITEIINGIKRGVE